MSTFLSGVQKAVVANRVDDPEVFVTGSDLKNLLCARQLDERGVTHLGAQGDDVIGVVFDDASRLLGEGGSRSKQQQSCKRVSFHRTLIGICSGQIRNELRWETSANAQS
jgi:hypothetical protein